MVLLLVHQVLAGQEGLSDLVVERMVQEAAGLESPRPVVDTSLEEAHHTDRDQGTEGKRSDLPDRQAHQEIHLADRTAVLEMADTVRREERVAVAERLVVVVGAVDLERFAMEDEQTNNPASLAAA